MHYGVILAGGTGKRLGNVRKADLRINNRTLLSHAHAALKPHCAEIYVSVQSSASISANPLNLPIISDDLCDISGPAAGLIASARHLSTRANANFLNLLSIDSPFIPESFFKKAQKQIDSSNFAILAAYGDKIYPTIGCWNIAQLISLNLQNTAPNKGPSLLSIAKSLNFTTLNFADTLDFNPFQGVNTICELLRIENRLSTSTC